MLTVILKGTNGCNLNCSYCSLGEKTKTEILSFDQFIEILDYICRVCANRRETEFNIILHGGEPTLVPAPVYRNAFNWMKINYPDIQAHIMMQTNGFHISKEMLEFIIEYHVAVGVSVDGSKEIHDAERRSSNSKDTFQTVKDNIELLIAKEVHVSCLMVLTSNGISEDYRYIQYFADKGLHLKINPLLDYGEVYKNPELTIKPGEYANYLIGLFEYIVTNDIDVAISPLDKYIQARISKTAITECTYNRNCNKNFLCIDHLGEIYPCGKFSDIKSFNMGNVASASVDIDKNDIMKRLLARRDRNRPNICQQCKYVSKCNGGCTAEAAIEGDMMKPPKLCADYKMLFDYFDRDGLIFLRDHLMYKRRMLVKKQNGL